MNKERSPKLQFRNINISVEVERYSQLLDLVSLTVLRWLQ